MNVIEDDGEFLSSFDLEMFLVRNPEYREELEDYMCSVHIRDIEGILIRKYLKGFLRSKIESGHDLGIDQDEYVDLGSYHRKNMVNRVDDLWKISNCGLGSTRITRDMLKENPYLEYFPFVIFDTDKAIQVGANIRKKVNGNFHVRFPLNSKFLTIIEN